MSEPAFLLTADESAIVMREHEGRWYAVRIIRGPYGTFEILDIRPTLIGQQDGFVYDFSGENRGPFGAFTPEYRPQIFVNVPPTLNDYGVSNLSNLA